ncbi:hypothetical protein VVR12_07285 [Rothia sp. LK2588]|uniref:hypothetical protein n=1 Tax=Rothia sp. LK2588 TaxID=3114369 RepID=UPI0034CE77DD
MKTPTNFSPHTPPPMAHPGPRVNRWRGEEHVPESAATPEGRPGLASLVRQLGWGEDFHRDRRTGEPTGIRARGVPSAGACYPVQWHLLCGSGFDLPAGCYTLHPETGAFIRRGGSESGLPPACARVVLTVLPRRTAARYHHRSPAVLIGDAAYAFELLTAGTRGLGLAGRALTGTADELAEQALLPAPDRWEDLWPGSAVEIPMIGLEVRSPQAEPSVPADAAGGRPAGCAGPLGPATPTPEFIPGVRELGVDRPRPAPADAGISLTTGQLARRRSPEVQALIAVAGTGEPGARGLPTEEGTAREKTPDPEQAGLGRWCSGQEWVEHATDLTLFRGPDDPAALWEIHRAAARQLVRLLAVGRNARPISGWVHGGPHGPICHGLTAEAAPAPPRAQEQHP